MTITSYDALGSGLRQAGFQSLFPVSAFLSSEKAEYSAILPILMMRAADYRAGEKRKAKIAPSLFDRPTPIRTVDRRMETACRPIWRSLSRVEFSKVFSAASRPSRHDFPTATPDPGRHCRRRGAAVVARDGAGDWSGLPAAHRRPDQGHPGPDGQDRRPGEENKRSRRGRCRARRYPLAARGYIARSAEQRARVPFTPQRYQQSHRGSGAG